MATHGAVRCGAVVRIGRGAGHGVLGALASAPVDVRGNHCSLVGQAFLSVGPGIVTATSTRSVRMPDRVEPTAGEVRPVVGEVRHPPTRGRGGVHGGLDGRGVVEQQGIARDRCECSFGAG